MRRDGFGSWHNSSTRLLQARLTLRPWITYDFTIQQVVVMDSEVKAQCTRAVELFHPGCTVEESQEQGQCSYTLLVSCSNDVPKFDNLAEQYYEYRSADGDERTSFIVQIRPVQYALDLHIAQAAKTIYPALAPSIYPLELELPSQLRAYQMERMRGTPLSRLLPKGSQVESFPSKKYEQLMESFAIIIAQGWKSASKPLTSRIVRADSPMDYKPAMLSQCTGKVGSSIVSRLEKLSDELPDELSRRVASETLERVRSIADYPVVLNHGDLIPSNILVDEVAWEITGIVDWAEAEYLPFGTCFYGLESLLGHIAPAPHSLTRSNNDSVTNKTSPLFRYIDHAPGLRSLFWTNLFEKLPEMKRRHEDVKTMRDLGVLLWYGYAWDDGAINRVVNEADDPDEIACLRAFLGVATDVAVAA